MTRPTPVLCPDCGCDIDWHSMCGGCSHDNCPDCGQTPGDIARRLIASTTGPRTYRPGGYIPAPDGAPPPQARIPADEPVITTEQAHAWARSPAGRAALDRAHQPETPEEAP